MLSMRKENLILSCKAEHNSRDNQGAGGEWRIAKIIFEWDSSRCGREGTFEIIF
jgi:hypothetical protein